MTRASVTRGDFIPIGATRIVREGVKGEAFAYTDPQGRPCAVGFGGRKQRPSFWHYYPSSGHRSQRIGTWFDALKKDAERKAEARAARYQPHELKVGDILVATWGYNQTNVDFYEVMGLIGKNTVELMEIESRTDHDHPNRPNAMCDHVLPCRGAARSGRFRVRVNMTLGKPWVKVTGVSYAKRWDGRAQFRSWWN